MRIDDVEIGTDYTLAQPWRGDEPLRVRAEEIVIVPQRVTGLGGFGRSRNRNVRMVRVTIRDRQTGGPDSDGRVERQPWPARDLGQPWAEYADEHADEHAAHVALDKRRREENEALRNALASAGLGDTEHVLLSLVSGLSVGSKSFYRSNTTRHTIGIEGERVSDLVEALDRPLALSSEELDDLEDVLSYWRIAFPVTTDEESNQHRRVCALLDRVTETRKAQEP